MSSTTPTPTLKIPNKVSIFSFLWPKRALTDNRYKSTEKKMLSKEITSGNKLGISQHNRKA